VQWCKVIAYGSLSGRSAVLPGRSLLMFFAQCPAARELACAHAPFAISREVCIALFSPRVCCFHHLSLDRGVPQDPFFWSFGGDISWL
jgi:hypothetical protein